MKEGMRGETYWLLQGDYRPGAAHRKVAHHGALGSSEQPLGCLHASGKVSRYYIRHPSHSPGAGGRLTDPLLTPTAHGGSPLPW